MKKKSLVILLAAALIFAMSFSALVFGAGSEPGSSGDPLVSKSYVDEAINAVKSMIGSSSSSSSSYEVVQVPAGSSLLGKEGSEIILRSGDATAIGSAAGGVSDVTAGKDLTTGTSVAKNHLLIVPREDGRGIKCSKSCFVMVRGGYTIE